MSAYVYILQFPDGKCYIGSTTLDPERRWNNGRGYSGQKKIKEAIDKHGWKSVNHVAIEVKDEDTAKEVETILIRMLDTIENGYNDMPGNNDNTYHELMYYKAKCKHLEEVNGRMSKRCESMSNTIRILSKYFDLYRSKSE